MNKSIDLPIDDECVMTLWHHHIFDGPGFVQQWQDVWPRLPGGARLNLKRHFQRQGATFHLTADEWRHDLGEVTCARFVPDSTFEFYGPRFQELSDDAQLAVIAHELAHCFLLIRGASDWSDEPATDRLTGLWGFAPAGARVELSHMTPSDPVPSTPAAPTHYDQGRRERLEFYTLFRRELELRARLEQSRK
jgi:hypothetical protein